MRRLLRTENSKVTQKLAAGFDRLAAENEVLKHRVSALEETVVIQKKKSIKKKDLFEELCNEAGQKAIIFTPARTQQQINIHEEKDRAAEQEAANKRAEALRKQQVKEQKEEELRQKRIKRERARKEKAKAVTQQMAEKEATKHHKAAQKRSARTRKQKVQPQDDSGGEYLDQTVEVAVSATTRIGRSTRLPYHLRNNIL